MLDWDYPYKQRSFTAFPLPEPLRRCKHWELASHLCAITTPWSCAVTLLLVLAVLPGGCRLWEWNSPGIHCEELTHRSPHKNIHSLRFPQWSERGDLSHPGRKGERETVGTSEQNWEVTDQLSPVKVNFHPLRRWEKGIWSILHHIPGSCQPPTSAARASFAWLVTAHLHNKLILASFKNKPG